MKFCDMPYKRIDFDEAKAEVRNLMEEFQKAADGEEQFAVHQKYYALTDRVSTQITLASIRHSLDTADAFYEQEKSYYDEQVPEYSNLLIAYQKLLYHSPYRETLEKKIGSVAFKNMELAFASVNEQVVPLMQEENALTTEYEKLLASAEIEWDGEILNLSLLGPYLKSKDPKVRKRACEKQNAFFLKIEEQLDSLYDRLVKNRTEQARILGFDSYTELGYLRMQRNSYGREQVENLRRQVKKYWVPFSEQLYENRRNRLGVDHMYYADELVYGKEGNPQPKGTPEEILEQGRRMYSELSKETKEFFDFMMENQLLDVFGRKTKAVGGYMTYIPDYHAPFIFANFNGTSGDVDVITHECGHAFQGYLSALDPIREHADIGMETAEVHSMSMEFFTEPWYGLFFEGKDAEDYKKMHLEDAAMFIPYGCMVDEFQHRMYDEPELTPAQRKEVWKELEQEYKPHMDYGDLEFYAKGGYWQRQHHIYSFPLYYIDYVIAQLCAFEYKNKMDQDYKEAWNSYLKLCRLSASDYFEKLLEQAGLRSPFEDGCIEKIVEEISLDK
ncbi:MAG: M3 family oligoendopeptidase [Firmicutes bacterium]|nr:M3 family oligoendopeptidase [Bacillota bacterium]MDY3716635.1 M3 family oligoendopeptidase [Blautia sp.]